MTALASLSVSPAPGAWSWGAWSEKSCRGSISQNVLRTPSDGPDPRHGPSETDVHIAQDCVEMLWRLFRAEEENVILYNTMDGEDDESGVNRTLKVR